MPKNYSIKDMNLGLIGLNTAAQAAFHMTCGILFNEGFKAATEKFLSIDEDWDVNLGLGVIAAITVGIFAMGMSAAQSKTCFDKDIFSKKRMEGALTAMVAYFGTAGLNLYWVRLSRLTANALGLSYGGAAVINIALSSIIQYTLFYCFSRPFGTDASNATIRGSYAIANSFASSMAMLPDLFHFDLPRVEAVITQTAFGGFGGFLGSGLFSATLVAFEKCCGNGKQNKAINDTEKTPLIKLDDADQGKEKSCCVIS